MPLPQGCVPATPFERSLQNARAETTELWDKFAAVIMKIWLKKLDRWGEKNTSPHLPLAQTEA